MRMFSRAVWAVRAVQVTIVGSLFVTAACSTERTAPPPAPASLPAEVAALSPPSSPARAPEETNPASVPTGEGRDPFAAGAIAVTPPAKDDRPRKSKRFAVDELKLVGIVSSVDTPRAMFVDPRGKGAVVTRGQLLGRAEIIHDNDGDHQVSWRVDRIRDSEVVLVREDAAHSIVPSSTKVLALRHAPVIADDDELED